MSSDHAVVVRDRVARVAADILEARVGSRVGAELGEIAPERGQALPRAPAGASPLVPAAGRQVREGQRAGGVRQKHLVIANAVDESGRREVIDLDVGEAQAAPFEVGDDRAGNRTEPGLGLGLADPRARTPTIGASRTLEPGEAGDPAVILSWTPAAP